jgi:hypothetical protein
MQQHLIDHTEHRCVGANPQRQRDHRNHGEAGALEQLP